MRNVSYSLVILLLLMTGCARNEPTSARQEQGKPEPKLKALLADTDRVLIKDFYPTESFSPAVPPAKVEGPYHITTTWIPGHISFEPLTVTESAKEQGKEPMKLKGIRVEIANMTYMVNTTKGEQHEHVSFLDDEEARDFDAALSYLATIAGEWEKQKPDHYREVTFQSKDSFNASLAVAEDAPALIVKSGELGNAILKIPASQIAEVQSKLRAALKVLDAR